MSKLIIDDELRAALLKAHGYKCPYTGEMIKANNFDIDHIIPQSFLNKPDELKKLLESLNLPSDFNLNSLENYLPCFPSANRKKSSSIFETCHLHFFLDLARKYKPKVEAHLDAIRKSNVLAKAENLLKISLARGQVDSESIQNLFEKLSSNTVIDHPNKSNNPSPSNFSNGDLEVPLDILSVRHEKTSNINESPSNITTDVSSDSNTISKISPSPLSDTDEKKIRNEKIISGIIDLGFFHLYSNKINETSYLVGPGPTRISITNKCIAFIFNSETYTSSSFPNEHFDYITSLHFSIKPLFDIIISLIQNDQTLESFSFLYDFSIKSPSPINFDVRYTSNNITPDLHGLLISGSYLINDYDKILDDQNRQLPPSLNSSYLEVLVLLYDIYWFISRKKYEKD